MSDSLLAADRAQLSGGYSVLTRNELQLTRDPEAVQFGAAVPNNLEVAFFDGVD